MEWSLESKNRMQCIIANPGTEYSVSVLHQHLLLQARVLFDPQSLAAKHQVLVPYSVYRVYRAGNQLEAMPNNVIPNNTIMLNVCGARSPEYKEAKLSYSSFIIIIMLSPVPILLKMANPDRHSVGYLCMPVIEAPPASIDMI